MRVNGLAVGSVLVWGNVANAVQCHQGTWFGSATESDQLVGNDAHLKMVNLNIKSDSNLLSTYHGHFGWLFQHSGHHFSCFLIEIGRNLRQTQVGANFQLRHLTAVSISLRWCLKCELKLN